MNAICKSWIAPLSMLICAGIGAGSFCLLRAETAAYQAGYPASAFSLGVWLASFLIYGALGIAAIAAIWGGWAWLLSLKTGRSFSDVLREDAATFAPCGLLLCAWLSRLPLELPLLTAFSASWLWFAAAVMATGYLKALHWPPRRRQTLQPRRRAIIALAALSVIAHGLLGWNTLIRAGFAGDEPHYLLIAHSLVHDHDLKISNNYRQRDYASFYASDLTAHVSIAKDGTRYPGHPLGLPLLLAPAYAAFGANGAIGMMVVFAALFGVQIYLLAFDVSGSSRLALLIWGLMSFTPPIVLYSSKIYPEIPAALLLITAYRECRARRLTARSAMLSGLALAILPWLHQRMILPTLLLMGFGLWQLIPAVRRSLRPKRAWRCAAFPVLCLFLSLSAMGAYYFMMYGNPLPTAPYSSVGVTQVFSLDVLLREGLFGHLLDQEAGLLIYAPYYAFALPGLLLLFQRQRAEAISLASCVLSIYVPCGGFDQTWRGGWSPVSRFMVALLPFLVTPLCISLNSRMSRVYHLVFGFCALISAFWTVQFAAAPLSALMRGTGQNPVFQQRLALSWLSAYLPSFPAKSLHEYVMIGFWAFFFAALAFGVYRSAQSLRPSQRSPLLAFYGVVITVSLLLSIGVPRLSGLPSLTALSDNQQKHALLEQLIQPTNANLPPISELAGKLRFEYVSSPKRGEVNQQGERMIVSGPWELFPRGKYTALFDISADSPQTKEGRIVSFEISAKQGTQVFASHSARGEDIHASGERQQIALPFELPGVAPDLETRVYFHNVVNVVVHSIVIVPNIAELYYEAGHSAAMEGQASRAETLWRQAGTDGRHALACYRLARLKQDAGQWEESLLWLGRALALQPDFADALYRAGIAEQQTNRFEQARASFEQAVRVLPAHLDAWNSLKELARAANDSAVEQQADAQITRLYQPEHPLSINFANQVEFLGYTLTQREPGSVTLEYWWKALAPMTANYVIFTHFLRWGRVRFQADTFPKTLDLSNGQENERLTSAWQVGEVIHSTITLPVQPGTFAMSLGLWEPEYARQRLPVLSPLRFVPFSIPNVVKLSAVTLH